MVLLGKFLNMDLLNGFSPRSRGTAKDYREYLLTLIGRDATGGAKDIVLLLGQCPKSRRLRYHNNHQIGDLQTPKFTSQASFFTITLERLEIKLYILCNEVMLSR